VRDDTIKRIIRIAALAGIALFLVLIVGLFFRVGRLNREVESLRRGLRTEMETQNQLGTVLESNQRTVTRHLQEVRRLLNLSPGSYSFIDDDAPTTEEPEDDRRYTDELFFQGADRIVTERDLSELEERAASFWADHMEPLLDRYGRGLSLQPAGRLRRRITDENGTVWATVAIHPDEVVLTGLTGEKQSLSTMDEVPDSLTDLLNRSADRFEEYRNGIDRIQAHLQRQETRDAMDEKRLLPGPTTEEKGVYTQTFLTDTTGDTAFSLTLSLHPWEISVDGESTESVEEGLALLNRRVQRTDPRTSAQRATERAVERLRAMAGNPAFQAYLQQRDLSVSPEPRETLDFLMFDLKDDGGTTVGSYAVQKQNGEIYLVDSDEIVITRLENAAGDPLENLRGNLQVSADRRDELPEGFPPGFQNNGGSDGTNILLFGTHENKADSIMLVHLSPERTISMISIPRDIWWKQRKLNYYNEIYGSDGLAEEISDLTDQPIDGWVSVDMYAFIEIVDILGGIDVTLDEPLVDPTYRVRENGQWGTLYYETGTHHLGGVAALRLARSRHTSNDFERALRQQKILAALRERINSLHAGDLDRVYGIIETLGQYVDSSYSLWQLTQFFLAYRNAEIVNRTGLTFDNVLYSTYSNVHLQGLDFDEIDDDFVTGEWILLPRGDDWSVIPWFVEENIR
jgi:polyisoprenyl-teichoic acid--peptidoglycan teichoic acid transferase